MNLNLKVTIIYGTQFDKNGSALPIEVFQDLDILLKELAQKFGGYTKSLVSGGYIMKSNGALVEELSEKLEVYIENTELNIGVLELYAENIKKLLNQESVLFVQEFVKKVEFV